MSVSLLCIALLGFLVVGLGFAVSMTRSKTKTSYGYAMNPADSLHKMVRTHGNAAEYAAMLAVLIYVLGTMNPASWIIWSMVLVTLSRYLVVIGLLASPTLEKVHPLRFLGSLGTYVFGTVLCVALVLKAYPW